MAQRDSLRPDAERKRLADANGAKRAWRRWGPYLSERQWGTVREDYSANGDAWNFFPHDHARSARLPLGRRRPRRLLRRQADAVSRPRPVERPRFDPEGADVRADQRLRATTARTSRRSTTISTRCRPIQLRADALQISSGRLPVSITGRRERPAGQTKAGIRTFDTGIFDDDAYFDIAIQYAKADVDDILLQITVDQPRAGSLRDLTFCRRYGSATSGAGHKDARKPSLREAGDGAISFEHAYARHCFHLLRSAGLVCCSARTRPTRRNYSAPARRFLQGRFR